MFVNVADEDRCQLRPCSYVRNAGITKHRQWVPCNKLSAQFLYDAEGTPTLVSTFIGRKDDSALPHGRVGDQATRSKHLLGGFGDC